MSVEEKIAELQADYLAHVREDFCESPLERLLLWAFVANEFFERGMGVDMANSRDATDLPEMSRPMVGLLGWLWLFQQQPARLGERDVRFDFALFHVDSRTRKMRYRVAVEVDGHDFHERTKEQAKRDRSRDRAALVGGWHVIRFTGSEVYADAAACVSEVIDICQAIEMAQYAATEEP